MLLEAGVSQRAIDEHAAAVVEACSRNYARLCPPDLSDKLVPGITDLLGWLDGRDDIRLSLVTGNFEGVARLKLKRAGIGRHFPAGQGAFGSDSEDRAVLPHIARKRAGHAGIEHPRDRTVVIGDTPRDIACARADQLRCLAVATGPFDASELTGADGVAANDGELRQLLENMLSAYGGPILHTLPWRRPTAKVGGSRVAPCGVGTGSDRHAVVEPMDCGCSFSAAGHSWRWRSRWSGC